jgi:hypothetical protein
MIEPPHENQLAQSRRAEMRGRVLSLLGYTMGELSTAPDRKEPIDRGRLAEAVIHCQSGYDLLKKTGDAPAMYMGLNNLVYYGSIEGDPTKGRFLLRKARELREAGDPVRNDELVIELLPGRGAVQH